MKSLVSFIFGLIVGATAGAYVAKSISDRKAEMRIEETTVEARDYYKEEYEPKKEEPKQESVFGKKDDLEANKKITRIYGHQFDLYSEPEVKIDEHQQKDPEKETYSYPIDEDEFGMDHDYTTYSLDYYADGSLVDETGNLVDDPVHLVGGDILDDLSDRKIDVGYVRNDITKTDYEICYVDANYEEDGGVKD